MACKTDVEFFKYLYIDTNRLLLQLKKPSNHLLFRISTILFNPRNLKNYTNNGTKFKQFKIGKKLEFSYPIFKRMNFTCFVLYSLFEMSCRERKK